MSKSLLLRFVLVSLIQLLPVSIWAQHAGNLDETFNPGDPGGSPGVGFNNNVYEIIPLPDNKHLVLGIFTAFQGQSTGKMMVLNEDGTRDASFTNGFPGNEGPSLAALQPDGKIMLAGFFSSYAGTAIKNMSRITADGSLDPTFNSGGSADDDIRGIAFQSDGKIIVVGDFETFDERPVKYIVRLHPDGSIDESFTPGTGPNDRLTCVAVQSDGKILVGGYFTSYDGTAATRIARLNADGTFDAAFATGNGFLQPPDDIIPLDDGKIMVSGHFVSYNGVQRDRVVRINANGSLDNTFSVGTGFNSSVLDMVLDGDKILLGGTFTEFNGVSRSGIARLNDDGSLDNTFDPGTGISGANKNARALAIDASGRILVGGTFTGFDNRVAESIIRLEPDGSPDPTVFRGYGASGTVVDAAALPDGKMLIAGDFTGYNGVTRGRIARLTAEGLLDETFDSGIGANGQIRSIILQPDGKIIIAGSFTAYNNTTRNRIARLLPDGSLDMSFDPGAGLNSSVRSAVLQPDGKIVVGGNFTTCAGITRNYIARLHDDGTLDDAFDPGAGFNSVVYAVAIQEDGKILVGGLFSTFDGFERHRLARLDESGNLDESFDVGSGANQAIHVIRVLPDQKILMGGEFSTYNGATAENAVRLHTNGSIDTEFSAGTGPNGSIRNITVLDNGKFFITGNFNMFNGRSSYNMARLYPNGAQDIAFNAHVGADGPVNVVAVLPDEMILIAGEFTTYRNVGRTRVARLHDGKGTPVITWAAPADIAYGAALGPSQLNASSTATGTFAYDPAAGTILDAGDDQRLFVEFSPADPDAWVPAQAEVSINVYPASQTITFDALPDRLVSDGAFELHATSSSGLLVTFESSDTDVVSVSGSVATVVGVGGVTITAKQSGNSNYLPAPDVEWTFQVKQTQAIAFNELSGKTFGDEDFQLPLTASSGLDIVYSSSNTDVATISGNIVTIVGAGSTFITATQSGNSLWAEATPVERTLVVAKADQVITFSPLEEKNVDADPFALTGTASSGLPLTYTSSNQAVALVFGDAVSITGAGTAVITASQGGNANYNPAVTVEQILTVSKLEQTITFTPLPTGKKFGDPSFALEAMSTSGLSIDFVSANPEVVTVSGNTVTITGAGEAEILASQSGNHLYAAVEVKQTLNVSRAEQYIAFDPVEDAVYGDGPFVLTATATSGLPVTFSSNDPLVATIEGDVVTITGAGTVVISATQTGNTNYENTVVDQMVSVYKADQTLTFGEIETLTYGQGSYLLDATATSGLPVSYSSSNPDVATVTGNVLSIHRAGMATITANQPGDGNYNAAPAQQRSLLVEKATQEITFDPLSDKLTTDDPFTISATSSSGLPVAFFSTNVQVAFVIDNTVTIAGPGTTEIMAVQNGNENYLAAPTVFVELIVKTPQTISFGTLPEKAYGDEPFDPGATASSGLPVAYTSSNTDVATITGNIITIVGVGNTTITATQEGSSLYTAAQPVSNVLTVRKADQTIAFESLSSATTLDAPFTLDAMSTSGLAVSFTSSNPTVAEVAGNVVTILGAGTTVITAAQEGDAFYNPASPVSRDLVVDLVLSLEPEARSSMRLYPNPTYGSFTIELEHTRSRTMDVVVYNALNMVVLRRSHNAPDNRVTLDLSELPQGVYLVELVDGIHRLVQRVVRK